MERGERLASELLVETFVSPGDLSWAERAASATSWRRSQSASKENTPDLERRGAAGGSYSKEATPLSSCGRQSSVKETTPLTHSELINFISGNPFVECTKGVIHLFKTGEGVNTSMMLMLGVPAKHKTTDLLQLTAPCHLDLEYMRIIHDGSPNQYMVLLKFRAHSSALEFHSAYNGLSYNSLEPEVCCVLPVEWVEVCGEGEYQPPLPSQATELPYCTICLERMDESVSTVLTILCNHKFHSECLSHWEDPTCPVCRYVQVGAIASTMLEQPLIKDLVELIV